MATKVSTGLRNRLLDGGSLKSRLALGFIDIYSGSVPATADAALSGNTKLVRISNNSSVTGLTFDTAASGGVLAKNTGETWSGIAVADGTPSFYRFVTASDDGTLSTTQERVQGTVGVGGGSGDLVLSASSISATGEVFVDTYTVTLPTA